MKQYIKNGLLVVTGGLFTIAGVVYGVSTWQDTTYIQDGQVIEADTIKSNFDYLYERGWDFFTKGTSTLPTHRVSDMSVGAPEYCDERGENCFTAPQVINIINSTTTVVSDTRVMCEVTFDMTMNRQDSTKIRFLEQLGTAAIGAWSKGDKPDYNARWTDRVGAQYWGSSLFDSSERGQVGYYDADQYHAQSIWLSSQASSRMFDYAPFELEPGETASVTNSNVGTHSITATVGTCTEMDRAPAFGWQGNEWSSCDPVTEQMSVTDSKTGETTLLYATEKGGTRTPIMSTKYPRWSIRDLECVDAGGSIVDDAYCPLSKPNNVRMCTQCMGKDCNYIYNYPS